MYKPKIKKRILARLIALAKLPTAEEVSLSIREEAREGIKNEMILQMDRFTKNKDR